MEWILGYSRFAWKRISLIIVRISTLFSFHNSKKFPPARLFHPARLLDSWEYSLEDEKYSIQEIVVVLIVREISSEAEKLKAHGFWAFEDHIPFQKYRGPPILVRYQGRHCEFEPDKAYSTAVGIICPPGWDRVNCHPKFRQVPGLGGLSSHGAPVYCWFYV